MEAIQDHAIIGNGRSAALVSKSGSIDWLCWPRFDSPSIFGALLDDSAGFWQVAPLDAVQIDRHYIDRTNVLCTRFKTSGGALSLTDLMPVASDDDQRSRMTPVHEILRIAECEEGEVELAMTLVPRPNYRRTRPRLREAGALGVRIEYGRDVCFLRCEAPCSIEGDSIVCRQRLRSGQRSCFSLTFAGEWVAVLPPLGEHSRLVLEQSLRWWREWIGGCRYQGPAREAVCRSALLLKLLVYAPSGAVVAAPTTSLPERLGGDLNWDYRYCWLRDASLTARAFLGLGFLEEAQAFVSWLLQSTRLTRPKLKTVYDVHGNRPPRERVLHHLDGHLGSKPIRIGNAAVTQFQLDIYGEVIDAATRLARAGGAFDRETQGLLRGLGEQVCRSWSRPDDGMWEVRSGPRPHTHSRVLCWAALDRLLELESRGQLRKLPVERFRKCRDNIRREVEAQSWNQALDSYVSEPGGASVDANLLLLTWYGFEQASSRRMQGTYTRIVQQLRAGDDLLYRYRHDGRSTDEGAFGVCCFWQAEFLAQGGSSAADARRTFEALCAKANGVGLFGEEMDPETGRALGNFPQAFTHVGLINSALTLAERLDAEGVRREGGQSQP